MVYFGDVKMALQKAASWVAKWVHLQVEYLAFAKVDMKGREAVLETVEQ